MMKARLKNVMWAASVLQQSPAKGLYLSTMQLFDMGLAFTTLDLDNTVSSKTPHPCRILNRHNQTGSDEG
jgi:hypothetical protein